MEEKEILEKLLDPQTKRYGFNLLVRSFQERIYSLTRKMVVNHEDANDLVQETFIKVWDNIDRFRGESSLFTWVYRISVNECLTFLRKRKLKSMLLFSNTSHHLSKLIDSSPLIDGEEIQKKLAKAVLTLSPRQRLVFTLKYYEDLKYEEIASITNRSIGSLKANYHHAVKKIEEFLTKN